MPINDEVILSVEGLNQIHSFDEMNGIVECDAGCVLQTLQEKVARSWNHLVPIDMGSKGTCLIGGNVATNAGCVLLLCDVRTWCTVIHHRHQPSSASS